jgi:hypothetical protein
MVMNGKTLVFLEILESFLKDAIVFHDICQQKTQGTNLAVSAHKIYKTAQTAQNYTLLLYDNFSFY